MAKDDKLSQEYWAEFVARFAALEEELALLKGRMDQISRFSTSDKRSFVEAALRDPMRGQLSDREIARQCGVSHPFVLKLRRELGLSRDPARLVTRGGTTYKMETSAIGTKKKRNKLRTKIRAA